MDHGIEKTGGIGISSTLPGTSRVRFRERQLLRAADLKAEQSYLITTRRRHNIGPHGWGIVSGLELTKTPEGIVVRPGFAVDGYGRELIVPAPVLIPPESFNALKQKRLDVWLVYDLVEANVTQRGDWNCGPGHNARNRELASIRLTRAPVVSKSDSARASRTPIEVPFEDLPFSPSRISPDDPARDWPVYLGRIRRRKKRAIYRDSPRAYVSVTGELVSAVSGTARMQVGSELESDTRRFAVKVGDGAGKWNERLAIDNEGNTVITGNTSIKSRAEEAPPGEDDAELVATNKPRTGQLRLRENKDPNAGADPEEVEPLCARSGMITGEKPGSARMAHFEPLASEPSAAAPWTVYRTSVSQGKSTMRQLRFEIGHPGDKADPKLSKLVVGMRGGLLNGFLPQLTASADCTVMIEGDLDVAGELNQGPITPDPTDPAFTALIAGNWAEGTLIGQTTAAPATVAGTVRDQLQAVVPGATVDIENVATTKRKTVLTGSDGQYVVTGLAEGDHKLRVTAPGFQPHEEIVALRTGEKRTADVVLRVPAPPAGIIEGRVVDSQGAAVPSATVELFATSTNTTTNALTNDEGRFRFTNLLPGQYRIGVAGVSTSQQVVVLQAGAGETVILTR